eukprot:791792-Pleurochrysis_carterae.AAC.2
MTTFARPKTNLLAISAQVMHERHWSKRQRHMSHIANTGIGLRAKKRVLESHLQRSIEVADVRSVHS